MPGVPYKDFRLYMKSVTEDPPILATETIELPIQRPASGQPVYFELSAQEYCCDSPSYGFRYGFNPNTIGVSGSAIIYVSGGCSPYTWAVNEPGYTWLNTVTDAPENILQASNLTEGGAVHLSITDACGTTVIGIIQNNGLAGSLINSLMASLIGNLNEDYFTNVFNTRITEAEQDAVTARVAALEVVAQVDQLQAEYYVKFDIDGRISGFGLVGNEVSTDAIFVVDRFRIAFPTDITQYPVWDSLGVYLKGTILSYDGVLYSALFNVNAGEAEPSTNSKWQVFNAGTDPGNQVFIVGRDGNGNPTVGVNGNLVVAGSMYGEAINAASNITLAGGGHLGLGPGATMLVGDGGGGVTTPGIYYDGAGHFYLNGEVTFTSPATIRNQLNVSDGATNDASWRHPTDITKIDGGDIYTGTVTAAKIAAGTITSNEIAASTITAAQIAANTITASQIAANTITASQIAASTITGDKIAASTIVTSNIVTGNITTETINGNAVTTTIHVLTTSGITIITGSYLTVQSAAIVAIGGMILCSFNLECMYGPANVTYQILRGSTVLKTVTQSTDLPLNLFFADTPSAETYTYYLKAKADASGVVLTNREISLCEVKR